MLVNHAEGSEIPPAWSWDTHATCALQANGGSLGGSKWEEGRAGRSGSGGCRLTPAEERDAALREFDLQAPVRASIKADATNLLARGTSTSLDSSQPTGGAALDLSSSEVRPERGRRGVSDCTVCVASPYLVSLAIYLQAPDARMTWWCCLAGAHVGCACALACADPA